MNKYERCMDIVITRIMQEDARGRREPDPRLIRSLKRLIRMSSDKGHCSLVRKGEFILREAPSG